MASQKMTIKLLDSVDGVEKYGVFQSPGKEAKAQRIYYGTLVGAKAYVASNGTLVSYDVFVKDNMLVTDAFGELVDFDDVDANSVHTAGDGSDHADVATNSVITAKALMSDSVYQAYFDGVAATGLAAISSATDAITPKAGDKILFSLGFDGAGAVVAPLALGTDLAVALVDDSGTIKASQLSNDNLSANSYMCLVQSIPTP